MTQERLGVNALSATPAGLFVNKHYNKRLQNYDIRLGTNGGDEWSWNRGALRLFYNSDQSDYNATPTGAGNNGNLYRMDHFMPDNEAVSSWKMSVDYYGYDALNRLQAVQENQVDFGVNTLAYRQENTFDRWCNRTIHQTNTWALDGSVWSEDALPTGAVAVGDADGWNWVTANPTAFSGTSAHASANAAGVHQHYFYGATTTLTPSASESLYAWVYLDPTSPPTEVMLQWNNGDWEHRAYWGADQLGWDANNTNSRRYMGTLPATGGWVRLEVPASSVGLVGQAINGMAFSLYGGKATWDRAGKTAITGGGINKDKYTVDTANNNNRFTDLAYDAAGNVIKEKLNGTSRMEYKYNGDNHIIAAGLNIVSNNLAPTSQYFYDANSKRTRKIVSGTETWFVYGLDGELIAEYNVNGATTSPQKEYGYRGGQLLVVYDASEAADKQLQWLVADHLGTPRMVIDKTGSLTGIKRHDYLPFGEEIGAGIGIRSASNGFTQDNIRKKFTGYERDNEIGIDFAQARYYAYSQGRFTSADNPFAGQRIDIPQSWNLYQYCHDNPITFTDPDGRSTHTDANGRVVAVYLDDNDFGVYRHKNLGKWNGKTHLARSGKGIAKMGETAYLDEFRAHDSYGATLDKIADGARIRFGESFDKDIQQLNQEAIATRDLREIGEQSRNNQDYDIKVKEKYAPDGPSTGKLLNGKYATARSAGNYLAGLNGATGTYFGQNISFETYMKLAGALQQGQYNKINAAKIVMYGKAYGPAPWYGELEYTGRRVLEGFRQGEAQRVRAK